MSRPRGASRLPGLIGSPWRRRVAALAALLSGLALATGGAGEAGSEGFQPSESRLLYPVKGQPSDVIVWRKLTRQDFEGEEPPAHLASHAGLIGAVSCVGIGLPPDASALLTVERLPGGEPRHVARLYRPRFTAVFDRLCSWWNPQSDDAEYLLQHEQIHFDLTEAAARRLTRDVREDRSSLVTRAATPQSALAKLDARISIITKNALRDLQARHARFDEETSVVRSRERQAEWAQNVESELASSAESAEPSAR